MNILFLGDLVGWVGCIVVIEILLFLVEDYQLDFVVVNGENVVFGFGIIEIIFQDVLDVGVDVVMIGNYVWDQRDMLVYIECQDWFLWLVNYLNGMLGWGVYLFIVCNGVWVMVVNVMGCVYMDVFDDLFVVIENVVDSCLFGDVVDVIIIDVYVEVISEKQVMGYLFDGWVSFVVGMYIYVLMVDYQILENGMVYFLDVGMCGVYDSVFGMDKEELVNWFQCKIFGFRFILVFGEVMICGVVIEIDDCIGLVCNVVLLRIGGWFELVLLVFWV